MTSTIPASPSLVADRQSESKTKGTRHRRKGVTRDAAHDLHRTHRRRWYRRIQHIVLDRLTRTGSLHAADLDDIDLPDGISRSVIGTAILDLARTRLIRRVGRAEPSNANGRHSSFLHTWQLAVDRAAVESWKLSHPVPSDSEHETTL
jgi:hypothetical protein